jgi:hypothetical protein
MAIILLSDVNIQGHIDIMVKRMQGEHWIDFWNYLEIHYASFAKVGLKASDSDSVIWNRCQERQLFLLTNNRNDDALDSLENTIRTCNTIDSLPVFTISDAERLRLDGEYCDRVIEALFDYLLAAENILGTGRLYLPGKS